MAFDRNRFTRQTSAFNEGALTTTLNPSATSVILGGPRIYSYATADDTAAEIAAANYFAEVVNELSVGDVLITEGSDASAMLQIATLDAAAGTVTVTPFTPTGSVDTANLVNGAVTNAKVNAAAAIAWSKMESLTDSHILVGSGSDVAIDVAVTGDVSISNTGVTTVSNSLIQKTSVNISAADFNGMYVTPKPLLATPGTTSAYILHHAELVMTYGTTQFAGGGNVSIRAGTQILTDGVANTVFQAANNVIAILRTGEGTTSFSQRTNNGLVLSNDTAAFTTGDSTFVLHLWYSVIATS